MSPNFLPVQKYQYLWVLLLILVTSSCEQDNNPSEANDLASLVNPFIGTGGHGHTFPGASHPFGMVQLSPDTRLEGWDGCSGYHYTDSIVYGFSHTHLSGTGVPDYCDILLKPCIGPVLTDNGYKTSPKEGYASFFSKQTEQAAPGFYSMHLNEGIAVELTTTPRTGLHKYTFEKADNAHIVLDLKHRDQVLDAALEIVDDHTVRGFRRSKAWAEDQHVYFYAVFSEPFSKHKTYEEAIPVSAGTTLTLSTKAHFQFDLQAGESVMVKVGISAVDLAGAQKNLEKELPDWDFDAVKQAARDAWNKELSKIQVAGEQQEEKTIFYSALYHTMLAPNLFSDVDGRFRKALPKNEELRKNREPIGQLDAGQDQYTIFSLWDTYRATHPLYTIIDEKRTNAFINTFLRQYTDGGQLPVWELACNYTGCMIGYHSVSVIADAHTKGIRDYDVNLALEAMQHSAEMGNLGLSSLVRDGFIAAEDEPESVSKTLEYAYDDWCIAKLAKELGNDSVFKRYSERAQYYKNLFNKENQFLMGRSNGGWFRSFRPEEVNFNYTEANGWQYSLAVPQDIEGLIQLMGGPAAFEAHLDQMFATSSNTSGRHQVDITGLIGQYAHGNEPSHHMAYLYNYAGKPWKTQAMIQRIMDEMYQNAPDGLSGNEDCGQMSAWYVFSSLGFYPVCPGSDEYVIGKPEFPEASIHLENGNTFTIKTNNQGENGPYIQSVSLNGEPYSKSYIRHADITRGGTLEFTMGASPNPEWASTEKEYPHSAITEQVIAIVPAIVAESKTFEKNLTVNISSPEIGANIYYTLDGSEPTTASTAYATPIVLTESAAVRAIAQNSAGTLSKTVYAEYLKTEGGRSITLGTTYANQYAAGGDKALIDRLRGGREFRTGNWQGYEGINLEAVVDLGKTVDVHKISLGCLQDIKSWIWFPPKVDFYFSMDGKNFTKAAEVINDFSDSEQGSFLKSFEAELSGKKARYIKVVAQNYGKCPEWHMGAGGTAWLFVDELIVE